MTVSKLAGARARRKAQAGKCKGRKSYVERDAALVAPAKKLHRCPVDGRRRSLREVSAALAKHGYLSETAKPFTATAVARMVKQCLSRPERKADFENWGLERVGFLLRSDRAPNQEYLRTNWSAKFPTII